MFVTVTPNGSVDTVLRRLGPPGDEEQEVLPVDHTAGGKGHNVARFLAALGQEVTACGFAGGWCGREMRALLEGAGVCARLTAIGGRSRRYTTCIGGGVGRLSLHSPGPSVTTADCQQLVDDVVHSSRGARALILAGSLPPGAPADLYASIIRAVAPTPVILDTAGESLVAALAASPRALKVNAREAAAVDGSIAAQHSLWRRSHPFEPRLDRRLWAGVPSVLAGLHGLDVVWVTLGPGGAVGWIRGESLAVATPKVVVLNSSGAGDAFLAGWLVAEAEGRSPRDAAVIAAAMAAALCEQESPRPPDPRRVAALRSAVVVR